MIDPRQGDLEELLGHPVFFEGVNTPDETPRLARQHEVIKELMLDGVWRTLGQIADATGYKEASISAQLRHLRKRRFGGYVVRRRKASERGLFEYRVEAPQ